MVNVTKAEIRQFRKSGKKILKEKKFKVGYNPARNWSKYKGRLTQGRNYFIVTICKWLPPCSLKNSLYRAIGAQIGRNVSIANDAILDTIFPELISIGDNVIIGWGTKIFTHEFSLDSVRIGSVIIRKNSMIGEFSVVRPGITMGKNSMIAAMSFVNEDVGDNVMEGGVPIHIIKHYKRRKK